MDDEIKEILDKLNNKAEHYILYDYEVKSLLVHITNLQEEKENFKSRLEKAIRIIDKFKETYIICFEKDLWGFVKRLEKCLTGGGKNV